MGSIIRDIKVLRRRQIEPAKPSLEQQRHRYPACGSNKQFRHCLAILGTH